MILTTNGTVGVGPEIVSPFEAPWADYSIAADAPDITVIRLGVNDAAAHSAGTCTATLDTDEPRFHPPQSGTSPRQRLDRWLDDTEWVADAHRYPPDADAGPLIPAGDRL